ncbi:hypothetical protein [Leptolyngbya sp. FACHB-711]|uniref:hypothetical protein n=1 Tax=unclassified Leptolyngbya TaxID=2650499 RepID=UPI001683CE9B|nr:hypothetical protein [Leptolyngbya sp. FACHB-711]MBD1850940.1 hypothetical protein [Cyanobacteria bacterium FACHB-502]MBD2027122.1 hypothetical protein [Leptolyngbya sp. FACHB-711]
MTDSMKDQLATDLEKAKTESGMRANRLRAIAKAAAVEAIAEVKAGSKELGSIAKNSFSTVAANSNTPAENPAAHPETDSTAQQIIRFKTLILSLIKGLRERLDTLDTQLDERYGDRYQAAKRQLEQSAVWYSTTLEKAKASPAEPALLEQKQSELTARAEAAGVVVAQKEQQIKQQIKTILKTINSTR